MKSYDIVRAVQSVAENLGYAFFTGTADYMPSVVDRFPAVFVPTPEFRSIEGRSRGRITYRMTVHMLDDSGRLSMERRATVIQAFEQGIMKIFEGLSLDESVVAVENISMKPSALALTAHGDIAQSATADVICTF